MPEAGKSGKDLPVGTGIANVFAGKVAAACILFVT
jgi:hypothetical protein